MIMLARDDPPAQEPSTLPSLVEIENRIAAGIFSVEDWWGLEQMSLWSGLNSSTCRSALYELRDSRVVRFRCRSGHAFSAQSLLSGQPDAREMQLSSLFGEAIEEATLAKRMLTLPAYREHPAVADGLSSRVDLLERETTQVSEWLHATKGLVAPEPYAQAPTTGE